MLPFCGYNMADYFNHWLKIGRRPGARLPKIFYVNWFRKDSDGRFLWPGYGENSRVLAWIFRRCQGIAGAVETPTGLTPQPAHLDLTGLDLPPETLERLLDVDRGELTAELPQLREHLTRFGERLPTELQEQLTALERRIATA